MKASFRDYAAPQRTDSVDTVREFYRLNHTNQTLDFVLAKKAKFLSFNQRVMTQWAVVGDTFPTGCAYSNKIVYPEFFEFNADHKQPELQTQHGIYSANCGLENVHMSWGHDEYLYHLMQPYLPLPALYMIRFHSFYAWHREGEYQHLCNAQDDEMKPWVQRFNPYDLYSKNPNPPKLAELKPYFEDLLAKYLPSEIRF